MLLGLFSKAVWYLEANKWNSITGGDAAETGSGPGSYNIKQSVWHVNCCNPELNGGGGWGVFNSLLGWTNSATYGTVIAYNLYWLTVIVMFLCMRYYEAKGHWPLMKPRTKGVDDDEAAEKSSEEGSAGVVEEKTSQNQGVSTTSTTREIPA